MSRLKQELINLTETENRALTYRSTQSAVLDFYYHAGAKRGNCAEVVELFKKAYAEDRKLAVMALFNLRDVRKGKGERELFRQCASWLAENDGRLYDAIAHLIPEYGRWDDVFPEIHRESVERLVKEQFMQDIASERPSLLAKWLPSPKTSSKKTMELAVRIREMLGLDEADYRKHLSELRKKLRIVERKMSAGEWGEIQYPAVPSRASMIYRRAFERHDGARYGAFITAVQKGEAKINAGTLYPYELVDLVIRKKYDQTVQALWDALPDKTDGKNGLVVVDVSGSMEQRIGGTKAQAISVSISLGIYFAQKNKGVWSGCMVTFSQKPKIIQIDPKCALDDAVEEVMRDVGFNTDIQAVFDLILERAKQAGVAESDMPNAIWIVSDMEFDMVDRGKTNLEVIREKYREAGYEIPALVFWNVASRGMQTPATKNEQGIILVSGFSPSAFEAAMESRVITPMEMMLRTLSQYTDVSDALDRALAIR